MQLRIPPVCRGCNGSSRGLRSCRKAHRRRTNMGRLSDRVALITGATGAIGTAITRVYAREGADLVLIDLTADKAEPLVNEVIALGRQAMFSASEVTSREAVTAT